MLLCAQCWQRASEQRGMGRCQRASIISANDDRDTMHRFSKGILAAGAAMLMMFTGAASASANVKPDPTASVMIGGHLYGPKDGLVVDTQQFDVTRSVATVSPMLVYN